MLLVMRKIDFSNEDNIEIDIDVVFFIQDPFEANVWCIINLQ